MLQQICTDRKITQTINVSFWSPPPFQAPSNIFFYSHPSTYEEPV